MTDYGGFEHNLQSLRVVDELEERYAEFAGLNLTFESREGILKHCSLQKARELGEVGERFIHKQQAGLEAQLVNLADEIAYNNHDVDDGLRAKLIDIEQLCEVKLFNDQFKVVTKQYPKLGGRRLVHETIRRMINYLVVDLVETSQSRLTEAAPESIDAVRKQPQPLIGFSENVREESLQLKRFLRNNLYRHYRVHRMTVKAGRILSALFNAFMHDIRLMPPEHQHLALRATEQDGDNGRARTVADYVAGMTDRFAITEHQRIFAPDELT